MSLPIYNPVRPAHCPDHVRLLADCQHARLYLLHTFPELPRPDPNVKLRHESDDEYALQQTPEKEPN